MIDTVVTRTWLQTEDCLSGCPKISKFDNKISNSFKNYFRGVEIDEKSYVLSGNEASDQIQFSNGIITNLPFVSVHNAKGILKFEADGVLGLSPKGCQLIIELQNKGIIDQQIFSLYLTESESNLITFGGFNQEIMNDSKLSGLVNLNSDEGIFWIATNSDTYW